MAERANQLTVHGSQFTENEPACQWLKPQALSGRDGPRHTRHKSEKPWYLLPHTGFNVELQIDQFERDLKDGILEGKSTEETVEKSFIKIEQDIHHFKLEYLAQEPVLPIVLEIKDIDGQKRLVAPLYGNKPLVDTASEQERGGVVRISLESTEDFLLSAPPGSTVILTSPPGWSGFEGITYVESQTCVLQKMANDKIRGITFRTDMTLEENKKLLRALGKETPHSETQEDQIIDIVASPVFIEPSQGQVPWQFADVVNILKYIKGTNFAYKDRPFGEIFDGLKNPSDLLAIDDKTKRLVENLKEFFQSQLSENKYDRRGLGMALGTTILELTYAIRKPQMQSRKNLYLQSKILTREIPYGAILAELQTLPGCNGGGSAGKISVFGGSFAPRLAMFDPFAQTESADTGDFPCPRCGHMIIYGSGTKECPSCGLAATCG